MENGISNNTSSFLALDQEDAKLNKLRKTAFKYVYHWYLFAIFLLVSITSAYYYLEYADSEYKASSSILLSKDEKSSSGGNKDVIDAVLYGQPKINVQDEIETIKSRYLLSRVVKKNNLNLRVFKKGRIKTTEVFNPAPFLVEGDYGADSFGTTTLSMHYIKNGVYKVNEQNQNRKFGDLLVVGKNRFRIFANPAGFVENNGEYVIQLGTIINTANALSSSLKINAKSTYSNVIQLNINTNLPHKAEFLLAKIMDEYIQSGIDEKRRIHENTRTFINERMRVLSGELGSVEGQLESYKRDNQIISPEKQAEALISSTSENRKSNSELSVKKRLITYLLNYVEENKNQFNIVPTNLGIEDPVLLTLANQYNSLVLQRERELQVVTQISPVIRELESSIQKNRLALIEALKNLETATQLAINQTNSESSTNLKTFTDVPRQERQLGYIMRQEKIKNDLFSYLLQKREETEIALAGVLPQAKVLDTALASYVPTAPVGKTTYFLALFLGLGVPILIIWIKDLLNNRVNSKEDIVNVLKMPILGEIGHNAETNSIVVKKFSRESIGEQFRNLRSNVGFVTGNSDQLVLLTTSSTSGDGKSFASLNLAATYSLTGKRTVLVELDLRKPRLAKSLKIQKAEGVTHYLASRKELNQILLSIEGYENLSVLVAGMIPPNPAELLLTSRMKELIDELKLNFDVIILDCPPVGLVSDAQIISSYVDLSIFVIRQRITFKSQLQFINELYESKRLNNMAVVVNDVIATGYYGYYGYGSYYGGYGYNYGDYVESEKKQKRSKRKKKELA